ncbi:hypothetical protein AGMMS49949_06190 [Alphaproteobacteria bacterium]|nr:hypothetical protein AGMMS49949_06190 [Alphaproteobacteria bacterium]GHS98538.1 hypothetical protein AGMMS50296_6260 [Alphaproteobacteria bacterium]
MNTEKDFVYSKIAQLSTLSIKELREAWKKEGVGSPPSYWQRNDFVEKLAYKLQEKAFGGLPEKYQERLDLYAKRLEKGEPFQEEGMQHALPAGLILTREYDRRKYSVKILEDEKVEYNGKIYNSLSAVAREITGVRWNGRRFFHCEKR